MAAVGREGVLRVAVAVGGHDTIVVNLRQAHVVVVHLVGVAERDAVVVAEARVEEVLRVVLDGLVRLDVLRVVVDGTIAQLRAVELRTPRAVLVVGLVAIPAHTEVVLELRQAQHALPLQATVVLHAHAGVRAARLRRDENHAVGSAATVEGRSGGTLQDGHVLHVVGVHGVGTVTEVELVVQVVAADHRRVRHGHTVDDVEWLVGAVQRADTTDDDRVRGTRVGRRGANLHTGHLTCQARHDVVGAALGNLLASQRRGRVAQGLGRALDAHGRHHNLVEVRVARAQHDAHVRPGAHLERLHAHIRDAEHALARRNGQREASVTACYRTDVGAHDEHGHAHDRLPIVLRHHGTVDFSLGQSASHHEEEHGQQCHDSFFHKNLSLVLLIISVNFLLFLSLFIIMYVYYLLSSVLLPKC